MHSAIKLQWNVMYTAWIESIKRSFFQNLILGRLHGKQIGFIARSFYGRGKISSYFFLLFMWGVVSGSIFSYSRQGNLLLRFYAFCYKLSLFFSKQPGLIDWSVLVLHDIFICEIKWRNFSYFSSQRRNTSAHCYTAVSLPGSNWREWNVRHL